MTPALYDAIVELISDWKNEMRNRETVKILKRNVDVKSKRDTKSMFRYGQRLADLEAKYNISRCKDDVSNCRKEIEQESASAASAKATAASKSTSNEVLYMAVLITAEDSELSASLGSSLPRTRSSLRHSPS